MQILESQSYNEKWKVDYTITRVKWLLMNSSYSKDVQMNGISLSQVTYPLPFGNIDSTTAITDCMQHLTKLSNFSVIFCLLLPESDS